MLNKANKNMKKGIISFRTENSEQYTEWLPQTTCKRLQSTIMAEENQSEKTFHRGIHILKVNRELYRRILVITLPIVIQNLLDSAVNITQNDVDGDAPVGEV